MTPPHRDVADLVADFHAAFGQAFGENDERGNELRARLHEEEHAELIEALAGDDLAAIAHELADVVYVCYGTAHALGIPLDAVVAEIHRANMSKLDDNGNVLRNEWNKIVKPPNFTPANVAGVLRPGGNVTQ
jgi:predicted HAD superfamily Cof-like phosphohydrolase